MNFLELKDISERFLELVNPISEEKILQVGRIMRLRPGERGIDFGCGFGEVLSLWAEHFGISGIGIDIRPYACQRAIDKIQRRSLGDRLQIVCQDAAEYSVEQHAFDVAACIGATFIWPSFREALQALKRTARPGSHLVVGEAHWLGRLAPPKFATTEHFHTEYELWQIARQEGLELKHMVRASHDDWDRYHSANWLGLLDWIERHPDHPERRQVIDHLHESQEEYLRYGREHVGWALYVFK